jgi:hypothetical protein
MKHLVLAAPYIEVVHDASCKSNQIKSTLDGLIGRTHLVFCIRFDFIKRRTDIVFRYPPTWFDQALPTLQVFNQETCICGARADREI